MEKNKNFHLNFDKNFFDSHLYSNFEVLEDFTHKNEYFSEVLKDINETFEIKKGDMICRSAFSSNYILKIKPTKGEAYFNLGFLLSNPEKFRLIKKVS